MLQRDGDDFFTTTRYCGTTSAQCRPPTFPAIVHRESSWLSWPFLRRRRPMARDMNIRFLLESRLFYVSRRHAILHTWEGKKNTIIEPFPCRWPRECSFAVHLSVRHATFVWYYSCHRLRGCTAWLESMFDSTQLHRHRHRRRRLMRFNGSESSSSKMANGRALRGRERVMLHQPSGFNFQVSYFF